MLYPDYQLLVWLVAFWPIAILLILLLSRLRHTPVAGLSFFYITSLSLIHVPGAVILLVPWYFHYPQNIVYTGFVYSTVGVLAFVVGVMLTMYFHSVRPRTDAAVLKEVILDPALARRLAVLMAIFGMFSSLASPILSFIPSATALTSWFAQLPLVSICIMISLETGSKQQIPWRWIGLALFFPVATVMLQGFLGFGVMSLLLTMAFCASRVRLHPGHALMVLVFGYFMMSVYVTYMRDRLELRNAVWLGDEAASEVVTRAIDDFEWFDSENADHLYRVDSRLNQNWLVGAAVQHIELGRQELLGGELLLGAAVAIIPRAIWPDKPGVGGGGDVVSRLTGEEFDASTSVGAGQILEFYGSYAVTGVVVGMLLLGVLVALCDLQARKALDERRYFAFTRWFLIGMAMCQPGGNLTELSSSMISAAIAAIAVHALFERLVRKKPKQGKRPELAASGGAL